MELANIRDTSLYVHEHDLFSEHIRRTKDYYEASILDFIYLNLPMQKSIVDVGANIGNHSMYFARYLEFNKLYFFEPFKENWDVLIANIMSLEVEIRDKTRGWQLGLSNINGIKKFVPNLTNMGAGEISPDGSIDIGVTTLDDVGISDVTLLKIDVEWHEPEVLEGARKTIERDKPFILIEDTLNIYGSLLHEYGYEAIQKWPEHGTYLYGSR